MRDHLRGRQHLYLLLAPSFHLGSQSPRGGLVFSLPKTSSPSRSYMCTHDPSLSHEEPPVGFFKPELGKSVPHGGQTSCDERPIHHEWQCLVPCGESKEGQGSRHRRKQNDRETETENDDWRQSNSQPHCSRGLSATLPNN